MRVLPSLGPGLSERVGAPVNMDTAALPGSRPPLPPAGAVLASESLSGSSRRRLRWHFVSSRFSPRNTSMNSLGDLPEVSPPGRGGAGSGKAGGLRAPVLWVRVGCGGVEGGVGAGTHLRPQLRAGVRPACSQRGHAARETGRVLLEPGELEASASSPSRKSRGAGQTAGRPRMSPAAAAFETTGPPWGVSALTAPRVSQWDGRSVSRPPGLGAAQRAEGTLRCRWGRGGGPCMVAPENDSAGVTRANSISSVTRDLAATERVLPQGPLPPSP